MIAESKGEQAFNTAFLISVERGDIKPLGQTRIKEFINAFTTYFDPKPVGLPPLIVR